MQPGQRLWMTWISNWEWGGGGEGSFHLVILSQLVNTALSQNQMQAYYTE